ncbi:hypothetical protein [Marinobacter adhaerens]|uniref:hypothetical protein n=1 Tax=Marinobacter adhaerens TaxID=1033846 RepID=UPI003D2A2BE3
MANAETQVGLDALLDAILAKILEQFPTFQTVEDYRDDRDRFSAPACLVELTQLDSGPDDPGTGQLAVTARFEARLILSFRKLAAKKEIRKLTGAFSHFVHQNRWGLPVGPAQFIGAAPDDITGFGGDDRLDQFEVWTVEWEQTVHLGSSEWTGDDTNITEVYVGYAPKIGPDHVDDYTQITGQAK